MAQESQDDFGSLFEGMVLLTPQFQSIDADADADADFDADAHAADHPSPAASQLSPSLPPSLSRDASKPLDENLFSDLTLQQHDDAETPHKHQPPPTVAVGLRKKKRGGTRVGYARESSSSALRPNLDPLPPLDVSPSPKIENSETSTIDSAAPVEIAAEEEIEETKVATSESIPDDDVPVSLHASEEKEVRPSSSVEDAPSEPGSCFDKAGLESINTRISDSLNEARVSGASAASERKEAGRKRRNALRAVNEASSKYKELEKELEEACETEEFERAERVSESLAVAEKEKQERLDALREAEAECDTMNLKLQHVLELQIAAEEDGISLLEQFAEDTLVSNKMLKEFQRTGK